MARGFESKDVEYQQAEAERAKPSGHALTPDEREAATRRRTLELALARARADLAAARAPAHRAMLEQTIQSLLAMIGAVLLVVTLGCGSRPAMPDPGAAGTSTTTSAPAAKTAEAAATAGTPGSPRDARPRIVVLGDSLTAGLGLPIDESYPALLQRKLDAEHRNFEVVNAGVSGDTSAGGLSRLDWSLQGDVRILVVALGGNDALRGLPPEQLQHNLETIIQRAQARGIEVVLAGMEAPPNYGRTYQVAFHKVYRALAAKYHVALVPFLLQGVAGDDRLNQADGIHPTAAGARIVADNVWTALWPLVEGQSTS